jgi:hypothetical protein
MQSDKTGSIAIAASGKASSSVSFAQSKIRNGLGARFVIRPGICAAPSPDSTPRFELKLAD